MIRSLACFPSPACHFARPPACVSGECLPRSKLRFMSPTCAATCLHVYPPPFLVTRNPLPKSVFRFVSSPTLHLTYFHPWFSCAPFNLVLFSSHRPRATPVSPQPPDLCFVFSPVTVNKHHSLQIPGVCVFCFLGPPA